MNKDLKVTGRRMWLPLSATVLVGLALGCGEIGGAGQCNGVDVTGACLTVDAIVPTDPVGFGSDTPDVDAVQEGDCDGDPTTVDLEKFGEHDAKVSLSANLMTGVNAPPAPAYITLTNYTIEYVPSSTNLVAAPGLTTQSHGPVSLKIPTDGTSVTDTLEFVNFQTKKEYVDGGGSLYPPGSYSAKYTLKGTTQFNDDVVLIGAATFNIGDYDNCK